LALQNSKNYTSCQCVIDNIYEIIEDIAAADLVEAKKYMMLKKYNFDVRVELSQILLNVSYAKKKTNRGESR
jgi:hypothetical protein